MRKFLALFLVMVSVLTLWACEKEPHEVESKKKEEKVTEVKAQWQGEAIKGYATEDGGVQILTPEGETITVNPTNSRYQVQAAWMTADGEHIVFTEREPISDPYVVVTNREQSQHTILNKVNEVVKIRNEGVLYQSVSAVERYIFGDEAPQVHETDTFVDVVVADHSLSCGMRSYWDAISVWPQDSEVSTWVGDYRSVKLQCISNDGKSLFWIGEGDALFLYRDEKVVTIDNYSSAAIGCETYDSKVQVVSGGYDCGTFYILRPGKELETISKGTSGRWHNFYTSAGPLERSTGREADTFYALLDTTMYAVDKGGNLEKIAENIQKFCLFDENLAYLESGRLFLATFKNGKITDPLQIAVEVDDIRMASKDTVYYVKVGWNETSSVYKVNFESKEETFSETYVTDYHLDEANDVLYYAEWVWTDNGYNRIRWDIRVQTGDKYRYYKIENSMDGVLADVYSWSWISQ